MHIKKTSIFSLVLLLCSAVSAQNENFAAGVEPSAGTWKTWVIPSGNTFVVPPPPKTVAAELKEISVLQKKIDTNALKTIHYWNKGAPSYQWQDIPWGFIDADSTQHYLRVTSLVGVAIYDATIAAWAAKYKYKRARPAASGQIKKYISDPQTPSYPCEYSVTAGAAATILAWLYPAKADSIMEMAKQVGISRVQAGVQYPSDVKAGFDLGVQVAQYIIENWAKKDGWDKKWPGTVPVGSRYWKGKPLRFDIPNVKPWVLTSVAQFHSVPPADEAKDMAELKAFKATSAAKYRALRWEYEWPWGTLIDQKIMEYHLTDNAPAVARIYALTAIADHENQIANIESKYTYFRIRPNQYDTTFVPLFKTPPSPGYPAGHATVAGCFETVLSYIFPYDAASFQKLALEEAESRFEGGVHFRSDNEAGLEMGRKVGREVVKWAAEKGLTGIVIK
jgi:membrane-associated phospholipid phosphatase